MKYRSTIFFLLYLFLTLFLTSLYSQRSAAELISRMPPPKGAIEFKDGVRQINIVGEHLLVTNFWAGLQVVNVADKKAPEQTAFFPSDDEAYHTEIDGNYAYMANHATGVQVFDIADINGVRHLATIKAPGNALWVDAEYPLLYVALGNKGFAVLNISDINNPTVVKVEEPGVWVQQLYKKDNTLYIAAKKDGLLLYDVSNPEAPVRKSQFKSSYNTMMVEVVSSENGDRIAYVADGPGGLVVLDVNNTAAPRLLSRISQVGFVGSLYKAGSYVYLANRDVGLQIVNILDPANPFLESFYATDDISYGVYKKDIHVFLAANTATLVMRHNNAPILSDITDTNLPENEPFTLALEAEEPDGDPITYAISSLPEGATFDETSGVFNWTPTFEQSGPYTNIIFQVIEETDTRLTDGDTITLNVQHVNRLPDLPALEGGEIDENSLLSFTIPEGSDPDVEDQQRLTYEAQKLPEGATFDPPSRTFNWTPTFEQSGTYVVDFLIHDGAGGLDREPKTIVVNHVDRKPTIAAVSAQTVNEDAELQIQIQGEELDQEDLNKISFRLERLPDGASFDPAAQLFSWTPTYDQSGTYDNILAIMKAGNLSDSTIISVTVDHVNRHPALNAIADQSVDENAALSFTISGSDPDVEDSGKLSFSAANLPEGAIFDPASSTFSWTPTFEQSGEYAGVEFTINDPSGLTDSKSIVITTNHVNRTPQISAVDDKTVDENVGLAFQLVASDPDVEDTEKLVYSATGLPEGATLDSKTGAVSWTPTYDQSGSYPVTFIISDEEFSAETATTLSVNHVNRSPVIDPVAAQSVDESQELRFTISGSDPDVEDNGLQNFTAQNLPEGAVFDPATQTFSWTPTFEQSRGYEVTFTTNDPSGLTDQTSTTVTVNHVNRTPALAAVDAQTIDEDQLLSIQLIGSDEDVEDEGKLVYSGIGLPEGAQVDPTNGAFNWTPTFDQSGAYEMTLQVNDENGLSASQNLSITVNHVNRPPALTEMSAQSGSENAPVQFSLTASDPDTEDVGKLVFSTANLPEGANLDAATGVVSWTPTYDQSGDYTIRFQVTDSKTAVDEIDVVLSIAHVNREPALPVVSNAVFQENAAGTIVLPEGSDSDVEDTGKLTYAIANLPEGAVFDGTTRTLSWTATFEQSGDYPLTATISDPDGLSASQSFTISVNHVNRAPYFEEIAAQNGSENSLFQFTLPGADADAEDAGKLVYSATGLPEGASFDPASGAMTWTPTYDQSGEYNVSFEVKDSEGATASTTVPLSISHINRAPELAEIPAYVFTEDIAAAVALPAGSDPDVEDDGKLTYAAENLPEGAIFNGTDRSINWTPSFAQAGDYQATLIVSDPDGLTASQAFSISVENVNRPPQIEAVAAQNGSENSAVNFSLSASDPDGEDTGKLTFSAATLPEGASLDGASGQFSWTPTFEQSGDYALSFTVTDSYGEQVSTETSISIAHVNRPPTVTGGQFDLTEDTEAQVSLPAAEDADTEDTGKLNYRAEGLPEGASFDADSRSVSWKPGFEAAGEYRFTYIASDGQAEASENVVLKVANLNRSPQIQSPGNQSVKEGEALRFKLEISDPDKEDKGKLTLSAKNAPTGGQLNDKEFVWTPTSTQQGSYNIEFVVKDAEGLSDSVTVSIAVEDVPDTTPPPPGDGTGSQ